MKNFIAGPAKVDAYLNGQLMFTAQTILDSSITLSVSKEEVRGGQGNALWGNYYHTSAMALNLTDIMFKLEYLALNTGSVIQQGADLFVEEQVTLGAAGNGTIVGTPVDVDDYGIVGWVSKAGADNWQRVTFNEKTFQFAGGAEGDVVCVKYVANDATARKIVISSDFIPETVQLIMTANLYSGGKNLATSTLSGQVQVNVPRFQFDGNQEISMTSTGVANSPMSGSALANESVSCDGKGYYAIITEKINGSNWYDNVYALAVMNSNITVAKDADATLEVMAIPYYGSAFPCDNANLTFTSITPGTATVGANTGVVKGVAAGSTGITVVITGKPSVEDIAYVTVTGG